MVEPGDEVAPAGFELPPCDPQLALDLLKSAFLREPKNTVLSPAGLTCLLARIEQGAGGTTRIELERVLAGQPDSLEDLTRGLSGTGVQVEGQERLFVQQGCPLQSAFQRLAQSVDFGQPRAACDTVNEWASQASHGRIAGLVDPASLGAGGTRLLAVGSLYLRARWVDEFYQGNTWQATFTPLRGDAFQTMTMHGTCEFPYARTEIGELVELPYRWQDLAMVVLLPPRGRALNRDLASLNAGSLVKALQAMKPRMVHLALPRFEFGDSQDFTGTLQGLGVCAVFEAGRADLTGISPQRPLWLQKVRQVVCLKVDEEGTEAAALTEGDAAGSGAPEEEVPVELKVDRPFLFFVRHRASNALLFVGAVTDPRP